MSRIFFSTLPCFFLFFPVFPLTVFQYYGVILVYHSGLIPVYKSVVYHSALIPVYQSVVYHLVLILVYQSVVYHSGLILETARTPASHDRPWLHHLHKA